MYCRSPQPPPRMRPAESIRAGPIVQGQVRCNWLFAPPLALSSSWIIRLSESSTFYRSTLLKWPPRQGTTIIFSYGYRLLYESSNSGTFFIEFRSASRALSANMDLRWCPTGVSPKYQPVWTLAETALCYCGRAPDICHGSRDDGEVGSSVRIWIRSM